MIDETKDGTATQDNTDATDANALADQLKEGEAEDTTPADLPSEEKKDASGLPGEEGEPLPGEEKPDEKKEEAAEEEKPEGAPEKYEAFDLSAGEGIGYSMSEEQVEAFGSLARDLNLSQEQANKVIAFDIAKEKVRAESNDKLIADMKADGVRASRQKHGDKYSGIYTKNSTVYNRFFDEETRKKLNDYGVSSLPGFFNGLHEISKVLSEDVMVPGDVSVKDKGKRTLGQALS